MRDVAAERLTELVTIGVELLLAIVLTVLGLAAETAGLTRLEAGIDTLTLWYLFMGGLALYAGVYALGYRNVARHLRS
jgi:hypothetical protein